MKGFIDGALISFVKTYPYHYSSNKDGTIFTDKEKRGYEAVYQGDFSEETVKWSGDWEIIVSEEQDQRRRGTFITKSIVGAWEMSLKRE